MINTKTNMFLMIDVPLFLRSKVFASVVISNKSSCFQKTLQVNSIKNYKNIRPSTCKHVYEGKQRNNLVIATKAQSEAL